MTDEQREEVVWCLTAIASDRVAGLRADVADWFSPGPQFELAFHAFMAVPGESEWHHQWAEAASWVASGWSESGDEEDFR